MSVDIEEMAAHLERGSLKDVKEQYEARATSATAAFLLCFFLGYLGAHRFYLGQWRSGLARLALFILGATSLVAGFLTSAPLNAALYVIGGVLVLASLIWEIIDLGRIDREIHQRNTLLAEGLIAGALLSDPAPLEAAASKLEDAIHTAAAQSLAAGVTPAASAASAPALGTITADDLAQARALAEESGRAAISYHEISNYTVSATPEERAGAEPTSMQAADTERHVITEQAPASQESSPVVEETTYAHHQEGYRVTESEETDRVSGPSAVDVVGLSAAQLGYTAAQVAPAHEATSTAEPVEEAAHEPATSHLAEPAEAHAHETSSAEPHIEALTAPVAGAPTEAEIETSTAPATPAPEPPRAERDVTDAWAPASIAPAADVAFASSYPGYIALPEEPAPAPIEPIFSSDVYATPVSAPPEPEMPVYIAPEDSTSMDAPPATAAPTAESYTPPVPDVYSASTPHPETYRPSWEEPTAPASPTSVAPSQEPQTLAELAGAGAIAGGGALAAEALGREPSESTTPEATAEPAAPKMKRIRVKHRIVVEGQVVREETVEREVPADMDMAVAVRQIQAELEQAAAATPDEIARMANLSADDEVEVRRHVEGLGQ